VRWVCVGRASGCRGPAGGLHALGVPVDAVAQPVWLGACGRRCCVPTYGPPTTAVEEQQRFGRDGDWISTAVPSVGRASTGRGRALDRVWGLDLRRRLATHGGPSSGGDGNAVRRPRVGWASPGGVVSCHWGGVPTSCALRNDGTCGRGAATATDSAATWKRRKTREHARSGTACIPLIKASGVGRVR